MRAVPEPTKLKLLHYERVDSWLVVHHLLFSVQRLDTLVLQNQVPALRNATMDSWISVCRGPCESNGGIGDFLGVARGSPPALWTCVAHGIEARRTSVKAMALWPAAIPRRVAQYVPNLPFSTAAMSRRPSGSPIFL